MDQAAYYGLAGDVVRAIAPHSEADPLALLLQYLTAFGNAVGNAPYASSKARKGTSMSWVSAIMRTADQTWSTDRVKGGLSSGEGLINEVRDPVKKWVPKDNVWETSDPGVSDKRLMVIEPEFAGVLATAERHGNTLSPVIRKAWDGGKLSIMTKSSPLTATGAHVSIVGHITVHELRARLTRTDIANGFGNRFLYALVKRSKELPFGGELSESELLRLGERTKSALDRAKSIGRITWTDAAAKEWGLVYSALSADKSGLLGHATARAEAQTVRLATLYALVDGVDSITVEHLRAALAIWEYSEASAAHIFGNMVGDPVADEILPALRRAGQAGMTRTDISNLFGRHRSTDRIGAALALLMTSGRARGETRQTSGRPVEVWFATKGRQ